MRRKLIWIQTAVCAVAIAAAAPSTALANETQPPPHAQSQNKNKEKAAKDKDKKDKKDKKHESPAQSHRNWDPRFHGLDDDGNNAISRTEWNGDDRSFANHDWNRDGVIAGNELLAGATRPAPPRGTRPSNEPDEVLFARMDANRDNRLSRSEWTGTASEFDRLDANRDGTLSPYEFGVGR